jgi:chromosome segregation ATPase
MPPSSPALPTDLHSLSSSQKLALLETWQQGLTLEVKRLKLLSDEHLVKVKSLEVSLATLDSRLTDSEAARARLQLELESSQRDLATSRVDLKKALDSLDLLKKEIDDLKIQTADYEKKINRFNDDLAKALAAERLKSKAYKIGFWTFGGLILADVGSELAFKKSLLQLFGGK